MDVENRRLKEELSTAKKEAIHWSNKYHDLWYDVKPIWMRSTVLLNWCAVFWKRFLLPSRSAP